MTAQLVNIEKPLTAPPPYHLVFGEPAVLLVVNTSQVFAVDESLVQALHAGQWDSLQPLISPPGPAAHEDASLPSEITSISLNLAQACNLSCSYCYADEGRFGGRSRLMNWDTARNTIDRLLANAGAQHFFVGFIGGEPLLNREVLHASVLYAKKRAAELGRKISFGITTNGTLIEAADLELFRSHSFAVTISLDGSRDINDSLRPSRNSRSTFDTTINRISPLLEHPGLARIAARSTVTRRNLDVAGRLEALVSAGFTEIGFSPLRTSPQQELALVDHDWPVYLEAMKTAAQREWKRVQKTGEFYFSNLAITLKQLHRGATRSLPCGAARNYASVNSEGDYFTCHRTIDHPQFFLGGSETGPAHHARESFLNTRRVDTQEPCRTCWARYLCGGGCHAEVIQSGRAGCEYILGWLDYCLRLYPHILSIRPDLVERRLP